jgi:hypothetical protein
LTELLAGLSKYQILARAKYFSSPLPPDQLWGPISFLYAVMVWTGTTLSIYVVCVSLTKQQLYRQTPLAGWSL